MCFLLCVDIDVVVDGWDKMEKRYNKYGGELTFTI